MREILDSDPKRMVIVLAILGGFSAALDQASTESLGDTQSIGIIFLGAAVGGMVGGLTLLLVGGILLKWVSSWVGGKASSKEIRAAIAWSNVPIIWGLILWIPLFAMFGGEVFMSESPKMGENLSVVLLLGGVSLILYIWGFIVFVNCLAEVLHFSAWKALIPILILIGPMIVLPLTWQLASMGENQEEAKLAADSFMNQLGGYNYQSAHDSLREPARSNVTVQHLQDFIEYKERQLGPISTWSHGNGGSIGFEGDQWWAVFCYVLFHEDEKGGGVELNLARDGTGRWLIVGIQILLYGSACEVSNEQQ